MVWRSEAPSSPSDNPKGGFLAISWHLEVQSHLSYATALVKHTSKNQQAKQKNTSISYWKILQCAEFKQFCKEEWTSVVHCVLANCNPWRIILTHFLKIVWRFDTQVWQICKSGMGQTQWTIMHRREKQVCKIQSKCLPKLTAWSKATFLTFRRTESEIVQAQIRRTDSWLTSTSL